MQGRDARVLDGLREQALQKKSESINTPTLPSMVTWLLPKDARQLGTTMDLVKMCHARFECEQEEEDNQREGVQGGMVSGAFSVAGFAPGDGPATWKSSQLRQPGVVFDVAAHKNDDEAHAVPSASSNGGGLLSGGGGAAAATSAGEAEEGVGGEEEVNNAANNTQKFSCPVCLEEFKKWGKLRDHFKRSKHVVIDETTPKHTHKRQILELVRVLHQRRSALLSTPTLPSMVTWMLVRGPRKGATAVGGGRQRGVVGGGGGASNQCRKPPGYIDLATTQNREAQFQASQKEMLRRSRGFMSWIDSLKACKKFSIFDSTRARALSLSLSLLSLPSRETEGEPLSLCPQRTRERAKERERELAKARVRVYVCVCVCVRV